MQLSRIELRLKLRPKHLGVIYGIVVVLFDLFDIFADILSGSDSSFFDCVTD